MESVSAAASRAVRYFIALPIGLCTAWNPLSKLVAVLRGAIRAIVLTAATASVPAAAQIGTAGSGIYGVYALNVHGQLWSLDIRAVPGQPDALTGLLLAGLDRHANRIQDPITGYFSRRSGTVVILRGSGLQPGNVTEVYVGRFTRQGLSIQGAVHRLRAQSDFTSGASDAGFSASRQLRQPFAARAPRLPPAPVPAVSSVRGPWALTANGYRLNLAIATPGSGDVDGVMHSPPGNGVESVQGHYMASNGRLAFVRLSGGVPSQVFVGSVVARSAQAHALSGDFYPLTSVAGGHPESGAFPFRAARLPVYKLVYDAVEDGCLGIRTVAGPVTLDTCADSPTQLFAIEPLEPLPGSTAPRLAILAHETGACLGTDPPALGQRVTYRPCRYTDAWTFAQGIPRIATPEMVTLVNTANLCLGIDLLRPEPRRYAWLQLCRSPDPLWRLDLQAF